jgi:hypothetical protein
MLATQLKYQGEIYEYSHIKDNVAVYISQPKHYYDDWVEDGSILIVKYNQNTNNHKYIVLHKLRICECTGHIQHIDISKESKIAEPYAKD